MVRIVYGTKSPAILLLLFVLVHFWKSKFYVVWLRLPEAGSVAISCSVCAVLAYCTIVNYCTWSSHLQSSYASRLSHLPPHVLGWTANYGRCCRWWLQLNWPIVSSWICPNALSGWIFVNNKVRKIVCYIFLHLICKNAAIFHCKLHHQSSMVHWPVYTVACDAYI